MRQTIIDVGTNTVLMLIADYDSQSGEVKTVIDIQCIPRLGKGVDADRNISEESFQKAIQVLNEYKNISEKYNSESITATATSFIRDANNKTEFIETIKSETGIQIEVLSGDDEAKWTFWGGTFDNFKPACSRQAINDNSRIVLIDIGGGSTEISSAEIKNDLTLTKLIKQTVIRGNSIDVGAVRIKEKFFTQHLPTQNQIKLAEKFILNLFSQFDKSDESYKSSNLIGTAGTITTLAAIKLGLEKFEAKKVEGTILQLNWIEKTLDELSNMKPDELYAFGDFIHGREDIIIPGILILKTFMRNFDFEKITVSSKGLRYGIFLRESITPSSPASN